MVKNFLKFSDFPIIFSLGLFLLSWIFFFQFFLVIPPTLVEDLDEDDDDVDEYAPFEDREVLVPLVLLQ